MNILKKWLSFQNILIFILILFVIYECQNDKKYLKNEAEFKGKISEFEVRIRKDSSKISIQEELIVKNKKELKKYIEEVEELTKINSQLQIKLAFKASKDTFKLEVPIYIEKDFKYVKLPFKFENYEKWYGYAFTIDEEISQDSLFIYDKFTISYGKLKRQGLKELFKPKQSVVAIENKNPYIEILEISNIKVQPEISRLGIDIQLGYGLYGPYFGVGIGYRIIYF